MTAPTPRTNRLFKRVSIDTLRHLLAKRELEGGWNEAILAEIREEIATRERKQSKQEVSP